MSRLFGLVVLATIAFITPGHTQPALPSPPAFSAVAPITGTIAVTTVSARLQLPNSTTLFPSVLVINDGTVEVFVSIGGATITATACTSTTGTCASVPVPAGHAISGFAGGGYVAAITGTSTSVLRIVQFNGAPLYN